jgi:hypothetical protein
MAEILPAGSRDHAEVQAEIVAEWSKAVYAALATAEAQQRQARRWVPTGFEVRRRYGRRPQRSRYRRQISVGENAARLREPSRCASRANDSLPTR